MDRVSFVDHPGTEVALHNGLCRHQIIKAALHLRVGCPQKLIKTIRLHVVDIRPKGQSGDIAGHVVPPDHLVIDCLNLRLTPVHLRGLLYPGEFPADESDHPAVVHPGHHMSRLLIPDRIICRQSIVFILRVCDQLPLRINAVPPVQNLQPQKAPRHNRIHIKRLAQIILSFNQNHSCGPAVKPSPVHSQKDLFSYLRLTFQALHLVYVLRFYGRFDLIPFPDHVVRDRGNDILHDPVVPVQAGQQLIVLGQPGQRILCGIQKIHGSETNPGCRIRKSVHCGNGHLLCLYCIRPGTAACAFSAHIIPILQLGNIVFTKYRNASSPWSICFTGFSSPRSAAFSSHA